MNYNFPVSIQSIFTKDGAEVPRVRAIIRDDTKEALSAVSTRYSLIRHSQVADEAIQFAESFGKPDVKFHLSANGDRFLSEFTYMDHTVAVQKDDLVGFRFYAENAYRPGYAAKLRVAALRKVCMNGMVLPKESIDLNVRHVGEATFKFPNPDELIEKFHKHTKKFTRYAESELNEENWNRYLDKALLEGIVTSRVRDIAPEANTVWGLYNTFTYDINHKESEKASVIGKVARLNKVANWFDQEFEWTQN